MTDLTVLRANIRQNKSYDENALVDDLLKGLKINSSDLKIIENRAIDVVKLTRTMHNKQPLVDIFLQKYGLSNQEGIALMCLAEALLRVPDTQTRDDLIADKIAPGEWVTHAGKAESFFVNASTWGLMLTGRVITLNPEITGNSEGWLRKLTHRIGEPVIRSAMVQAMRIMGGEFVLGETIDEAFKRGKKAFGSACVYSFDMLGEAARTDASAQNYFNAYADAIKNVGHLKSGTNVHNRSGVSIKLSALHPRYEVANFKTVIKELGDQALKLAQLAASYNTQLSIDAEEADRLDISLDIFERIARHPDLENWEGLGLVIQAYGKRAPQVISWIDALAIETNRKFSVRLVKGAYWDSEIKHAQELGLEDFPVFTRKPTTDLSYILCAQELLKRQERLFCQFATHNAHTISTIIHLAKNNFERIEFQRLHGMGGLVYEAIHAEFEKVPPVRIYAPVGGHKDLLAYLVRRLLENGANSSFINRFMNTQVSPQQVVACPIQATKEQLVYRHPSITKPENIFGEYRKNSRGIDLNERTNIQKIFTTLVEERNRRYTITPSTAPSAEMIPLVSSASFDETKTLAKPVASPAVSMMSAVNPANLDDCLGDVPITTTKEIDDAFTHADQAQKTWDAMGGTARAEIINKAADHLEKDMERFMALLIREAGKTYNDALSEVREAIDFCRYYAKQAKDEFTNGMPLPGPTGETNSISLHGRGVFICISPWNFPLGIFLGQVVAALAAGNSVVAKPAEQTPFVAYEAAKILYNSGVPAHVLSLCFGGSDVGATMINHPLVAGVAFTGSTATAKIINRTLAEKPGPIIPFIAETGGQNVMFVDSTALLEQVTDDVIQSAFHSAGQRCSALRVLYLQDDIADNAITMIKGAMDTLRIGNPELISNDIGPVIDQNALDGLTTHINKMTTLAKQSYSRPLPKECEIGTFLAPHLFEIESISQLEKEQFGPILHVIRYSAKNLKASVQESFSTGYGLTLGIHTRMTQRWRDIFAAAPVGNNYVNRNMVGAVVGSQPFGGQGLSGTGFKAGGPRYLYRFAVEKTLTINTMAFGGNAELLTLD